MPLLDPDESVLRAEKAKYVHGPNLRPKGKEGRRFEAKSGKLYVTNKRLIFEYEEESLFSRKTGTLLVVPMVDIFNVGHERLVWREFLVVEFRTLQGALQRAEFEVSSPHSLMKEIVDRKTNVG